MAKHLKWPNNLTLNLNSSALTNSQPGSKGIWLSRVAYYVCQELGRPVETLNKSGNVPKNRHLQSMDQDEILRL